MLMRALALVAIPGLIFATGCGDGDQSPERGAVGELNAVDTLSPMRLPDGPLAENLEAVKCDELGKVVGSSLPSLRGDKPRCFADLYPQPDGSRRRPTSEEPQTGVVLYANADIDPARATAQEILDAGGIFIAGGSQLPGSTAPDLSDHEVREPEDGSQRVVVIEGRETVIRRVTDGRVVAIWWEEAESSSRGVSEWTLFTAGSPDEAADSAGEAMRREGTNGN